MTAFKAEQQKVIEEKAAKEALLREKKAARAAREAKAKELADRRAAAIAAGEEPPPEEAEAPVEEEKEEEAVVDNEITDDYLREEFDKLDVFGLESILDTGRGIPLFYQFGFEDWTMMQLRYELHILVHAFRRDVNDPDRVGIHVDHFLFYYNKYFKKQLNAKYYGADTVKELMELVRDTVVIARNQVVESQLPDDLESFNIFVMLTEEARRDRVRRIDLGDEDARLKLLQPGTPTAVAGVQVPTALAATMPAGAAVAMMTAAAAQGLRPPNAVLNAQQVARPGGVTLPQSMSAGQAWQRPGMPTTWTPFGPAGGYRPPAAYGQVRPPGFQATWKAQWRT